MNDLLLKTALIRIFARNAEQITHDQATKDLPEIYRICHTRNALLLINSLYNFKLEVVSCGARFLAPRPRSAPISFARPGPDRKIVNFMAPPLTPDRPDYIFPEPKQFSINPKFASFRLQ